MIGRVCGTGSYLPIRTVSNDELSHVMRRRMNGYENEPESDSGMWH